MRGAGRGELRMRGVDRGGMRGDRGAMRGERGAMRGGDRGGRGARGGVQGAAPMEMDEPQI